MVAWQGDSQARLLSAFITAAHTCGARLAIWQETTTPQVWILVSFQPVQRGSISDQVPSSFVYQSFYCTDGPASHLLIADLLYVLQDQQLLKQRDSGSTQVSTFWAAVQQCLHNKNVDCCYYTLPCQPVQDESKAAFISRVQNGLTQIQQGHLQKVVLARSQTIALPTAFMPGHVFLQLTRLPNQFVSLLSSPETGTWLGCSPELLLAIDAAAIHTVSLAGTRPKSDVWAEKEYQEQAVVNIFIREILHRLGLQQVQETPLTSMNIGAFKHLKTHFHIPVTRQQRAAGIFDQLLTLLHPTPALCGVPQQAAQQFIIQQEPFTRQLYTGYLGPCNIQPKQTRLYVNIRCMQLFVQQARLFLGAGITEASNPVDEWEETCLKSRTLLDCLAA